MGFVNYCNYKDTICHAKPPSRNDRPRCDHYPRLWSKIRTDSKSRTGQRLVLHGTDACPTRRKRLSYTDGFTFLHGETHLSPAWCRGSHTRKLNRPPPPYKSGEMPKWARCDNCTKWFLAIIKTPFAMRCRQAAVIGQNAAAIQGFGARRRHSA